MKVPEVGTQLVFWEQNFPEVEVFKAMTVQGWSPGRER